MFIFTWFISNKDFLKFPSLANFFNVSQSQFIAIAFAFTFQSAHFSTLPLICHLSIFFYFSFFGVVLFLTPPTFVFLQSLPNILDFQPLPLIHSFLLFRPPIPIFFNLPPFFFFDPLSHLFFNFSTPTFLFYCTPLMQF